jgi:hypothetical protein
MSEHERPMQSSSRLQVAFLTMLAVGIAHSDGASGAGRDFTADSRGKYQHVAYVDSTTSAGMPCRTGWWQTFRYGHVRPRWGTLCY